MEWQIRAVSRPVSGWVEKSALKTGLDCQLECCLQRPKEWPMLTASQ
jgi:hypothetical protein